MTVQVKVTGGSVYQGIFHGAQTDGELGVILRMVFQVEQQQQSSKPFGSLDRIRPSTAPVVPYMIIQPGDVLQLAVLDVDLSFGDGGVLSDRNQGNLIRLIVI